MAEQILAALGLAACGLLVVRLLLGPARQRRFDAAFVAIWRALQHAARRLWRWRSDRREAETAARDAIDRANRRSRSADGKWDGNVYQGKSFRKPRKPH